MTLLVVVGCSSGSYAPVSDRSLSSGGSADRKYSPRQSTASGKYYVVQKGDTLYSIAFRYGKDFKALARANGIGSHYRIYPGQKIRLTEALAPSASSRSTKSSTTVSRKKTIEPKPIADNQTSQSSKPSLSTKPALSTKRVQPAKSTTAGESVAQAKTPQPKPPAKQAPLQVTWQWPAKGAVIARFREKGKVNKGLNIAAKRGESVFAAASGSVVYAGSGLLGYGNLIIINHNQQYLSAYAHNSKIFVKEKDKVDGGEKIAEAGNSGKTRTMLHFEIRKDGKPVNPLLYLPKRK